MDEPSDKVKTRGVLILLDEAGGRTELTGAEADQWFEQRWRTHWENCTGCIRASEETKSIEITEEHKCLAQKKPVYIGMYTFPRWPGHNPFYIVKCPNPFCETRYYVDYPHGYTEFGELKFRCTDARCRVIRPITEKEIYHTQNAPLPPTREEFEEEMTAIAEKHGLREIKKPHWLSRLFGGKTSGVQIFKRTSQRLPEKSSDSRKPS